MVMRMAGVALLLVIGTVLGRRCSRRVFESKYAPAKSGRRLCELRIGGSDPLPFGQPMAEDFRANGSDSSAFP